MKCQRHPHSSDETAKVCWEKWLGRKADRKLKGLTMSYVGYKQVKCVPPEVVKLGNVEVLYFYKGVPKTYGDTTK